MKAKGLVIGAALVLALSAPVKADPIFDDTSGIGLDTSGTVFMDALYEGYEALSLERGSHTDLIDAEHFNHKARRAGVRPGPRRSGHRRMPPSPSCDRRPEDRREEGYRRSWRVWQIRCQGMKDV